MKKKNIITFLLATFFSWLLGQIGEISLQPLLKSWLGALNSSVFYQTYIVPIIIGSIPFILPFIIISWFFLKYIYKGENENNMPVLNESANMNNNKFTNKELEFFNGVKSIGITSFSPTLDHSIYTPNECMKRIQKHLIFMGILGSKWVFENEFEKFLNRINSKHGEIKFLLINPKGKAFSHLAELREGLIKTDSLVKFYNYSKKYPMLRVKLYDDLPSFRLIFLDERSVAVSRYKLDKEGHFESKFGWENPHLIISSDKDWSLYHPFEQYFYYIWDRSQDIEDYFKQPN